MIRELDSVVLTQDINEHGLEMGDVGAVVHCYGKGKGFEVEFVTAKGTTIALLTLTAANVRPMTGEEMLHVREFISA